MSDLSQQIQALKAESEEIHREIGPKQSRLYAIHESLRPLQERLAIENIKAMGDSPDWPRIIKGLAGGTDLSSVALINYAQKHLEQYSMYSSGHYTETQEACFKLMVRRTPESRAAVAAGVRLFLPMRTPHANGYVRFGIFEDSLSAHGSYELLVRTDLEKLSLTRSTGSRQHCIREFPTLEEAIEYIAKEHPYGAENED